VCTYKDELASIDVQLHTLKPQFVKVLITTERWRTDVTKLLNTLNPVKQLFRGLLVKPEKQALWMIDEVVSAYLNPLHVPE